MPVSDGVRHRQLHLMGKNLVLDESHELAHATLLLRQNGYEHAAAILAREWALQIKGNRKPRKAKIEVRLKNGGRAWIERERMCDAEEIEG